MVRSDPSGIELTAPPSSTRVDSAWPSCLTRSSGGTMLAISTTAAAWLGRRLRDTAPLSIMALGKLPPDGIVRVVTPSRTASSFDGRAHSIFFPRRLVNPTSFIRRADSILRQRRVAAFGQGSTTDRFVTPNGKTVARVWLDFWWPRRSQLCQSPTHR